MKKIMNGEETAEYHLKKYVQPASIPIVRDWLCPKGCYNEPQGDGQKKVIGYTECNYGFMVVFECQKCFELHRHHIGITDDRYSEVFFFGDLSHYAPEDVVVVVEKSATEVSKIKIYINYKDDGPSGLSGQALSITDPWNKLYIFDSQDAARDFGYAVEKIKHRLNPRIAMSWTDADGYDQVVNHQIEAEKA